MRVCVFDYGAGNLHSLVKAVEGAGAQVVVETDPVRATAADALVLPGVGAFASAAERLEPGRAAMRAAVEQGLPTLGICLGMQLLFDASEEGPGAGLGVVPGLVTKLRAERVPQIGWNAVEDARDPLFARSSLGIAYYANSYVCRPADARAVTAWSTHEGDRFAAAVRAGSAVGVQFHPEKSSRAGLAFVRAWVEEVRAVDGGSTHFPFPISGADSRKSEMGKSELRFGGEIPVIAVPAVDLRDGACVQLVGGEYANERVRLADPVAVARTWAEHGFRQLHVVDLDAATGRGSNADVVRAILDLDLLDVQVGGGVREERVVERLLDDGASRVVVGTRALEEMSWLEEMAAAFPGQLMVAADVRERRIVTRGWSRTLPLTILDAVEEMNDLALAGLLVTAVHLEGQMQGTDLPLMEDVAELARVPVYASGGVSTLHDLRALDDRGVYAAVIGMALYTGALDSRGVAEEFGG